MKNFLLAFVIFVFGCAPVLKTPCTLQIKLGYSTERVTKICGQPDKINRTMTKSGKIEQWIYYRFNNYTGVDKSDFCCVYFQRGVVTGLQD